MNESLMVLADSFDVMGGGACGNRTAYIERYDLSYEDTPYLPGVMVRYVPAYLNAVKQCET